MVQSLLEFPRRIGGIAVEPAGDLDLVDVAGPDVEFSGVLGDGQLCTDRAEGASLGFCVVG